MNVTECLDQLPPFPLRTIVHVGAHIGQEISVYQARNPKQVVWIEGDPETFQRMLDTVERYRGAWVKHICLQALVTDRDDEVVTLRAFSNDGQSSSLFPAADILHRMFPHVSETDRRVAGRSSRLDTLLAGIGLDPAELDILVIDVQGAEMLCLQGAGVYLPAAKLVEVECSSPPQYDGGARFEQVEHYMTMHGFRRVTEPPAASTAWHMDVIYGNIASIGALYGA